jgi:hypothetical protein
VSRPDDARPYEVTHWRLLDLDAVDGSSRDTGISGSFPGPDVTLAADFADDAGSFVLWDQAGVTPAVLVAVPDGRRSPVASERRDAVSRGFRALPSGAAQVWNDGLVTLIDSSGTVVEQLNSHHAPVEDVVVAPDGTWAVTAGNDGAVYRWDVDPSTGQWSDPEALAAHAAEVVDVEVDASSRFLFSVSMDQTAIQWDMGPRGASYAPVPGRPTTWLEAVCAVVGRDLTEGEWRHFLPARPYDVTCSDLR